MTAIARLRRAARAIDLCQLVPTDLLESHRTQVIHLEFTSKCNLRCTFCAVSQPTYKGRHLDRDCLDGVIAGIVERRPRVVTVNGHGETTIYRDWHLYCDRLLDAGIQLHIISNFGRPFSERELETLSRFVDIEISCDSHDPEVFALLRRGAELPTLLRNIDELRAAASRHGRRPPLLSFSCVVSDKNVLEMPAYAAFVRDLGVGHVHFCNLTKYPDLPNAVNPNHVTEMEPSELPRALAALDSAFETLQAAGIEYHCQDGLLDTLREKFRALEAPAAAPEPDLQPVLDGPPPPPIEIAPAAAAATGAAVEPAPAAEAAASSGVRYSTAGHEGLTRDCLDPWKFLLVQASREVMPCCWHRPIHSLGSTQPLAEVFNNTRMKELRLGLLTGQLPDDCRSCPTRGWTPVEDLRRKAWSYLNGDRPFLGAPWAMRVVPQTLRPFVVEYGDGWHEPESDPGIAQPEWQAWRWTGRRADCRIRDCRRPGLLKLRLGVDKASCPDQEVTLTVNGRILDRFVPYQAKTTREYAVGEELLDGRRELALTLATDKTFRPPSSESADGDRRELGVQVFEIFYAEPS